MRLFGIQIGLSALLTGIVASGCASTAPQELIEARGAYDKAASGPAAQYAPASLHTAQEALASAEKQFSVDGDSANTRDRAYTATRKAQLAELQARIVQANTTTESANKQVELTQAQLQVATSTELKNTQNQLALEEQQRADAERRAQQAAADLAHIAAVKQEPRGLVITLSGSVLFASSKSTLLPAAQAKLSQVADALAKSDKESKIVVEGYTDSQGPQSFNEQLSQARAEAVRTYLVNHGIASDRITAEGKGPSNPVADNASPEGRADNRRVEVVVQPPSKDSSK